MSIKYYKKISMVQYIVLLVILLSQLACEKRFDNELLNPNGYTYKQALNILQNEYGIRIVDKIDKNFFPDKRANEFTVIEPISQFNKKRIIFMLASTLPMYPKNILKKNIKEIYLASKLIDDININYGGTYDFLSKRIYLVALNQNKDKWLREIFHHEFSSLLTKYATFPANTWYLIKDSTFEYTWDMKEVASKQSKGYFDKTPNDSLFQLGFVEYYGTSNVENDINTYFELIFEDKKLMLQLVQKHPRIRKKYELIRNYLLAMDSGFDSIVPPPVTP